LKKYKSSLLFCDISKVFISKLDVYLVSIGNQQNTRQKMFGFLNTMLNKAKKEGIIQENILYQNAPVKKKEGQRAFLTSEELKALEKLKPESKNLQTVLNYFLFACYTGLRFTDLRNFRFKDIVDIDGQVHTRLIMHKTRDEVTIPLITKAQALIPEKGFPNQRVFKVRCNQVSNRDLKVLMNLAKIEKSISMHCARHTFATVALSLGIDIMVISKILGHKELGTTRIYAKLQDKRKIEEMKKWETA
jgi:integrase/recombinase XerC